MIKAKYGLILHGSNRAEVNMRAAKYFLLHAAISIPNMISVHAEEDTSEYIAMLSNRNYAVCDFRFDQQDSYNILFYSAKSRSFVFALKNSKRGMDIAAEWSGLKTSLKLNC